MLGTNQTTVSRRIERLEAALSIRLFEPGPRGASPTDAADRLRDAADRMADAADAFHRQAEALGRRLSGTLRLTANPTAMRYAAGMIREFQDLHPGTRFMVDTETRTLSLEKGEADVAVRPGVQLRGDHLFARKLIDHPWGFYASTRYVQRFGVPRSFEDLAHHRVIRLSGEHGQIEPIRLAQSRIPTSGDVIEIASLYALIGFLRAGEGVGLLPRAEGDTENELVFCFGAPDLVQGLWIVTSREGHNDPLIRAFMRFGAEKVAEIMRDLPSEWRV